MTDCDKRRQKAALLVEFQEAEEELAYLEERAKALAVRLRDVADWLEESTFPDFLRKPSVVDRHSKLSDDASQAAYLEALNFERAKDVVLSVLKAKDKVKELGKRKSAIGIK